MATDANMAPWTDAGDPAPQTSGAVPYAVAPDGTPLPSDGAVGAPQPPYLPFLAQPAYGGQATGPLPTSGLGPVASSRHLPDTSESDETIILVFRDGRAPLQVRNYILTRSAVYLPGKHFNEIPLSDLDLEATQRVNWAAGVTFRLP